MTKFDPKNLDALDSLDSGESLESLESLESSSMPRRNEKGIDSASNAMTAVSIYPWVGLDPDYERGKDMKTVSASFNPWEKAILEHLEKHTPLSTRQRIRKIVHAELEKVAKKIDSGKFRYNFD